WWERKPVRENADNRERGIVDFQMRPRQVQRRLEMLLPISVADNSNRGGAFPRVRGGESSAHDRLNPKDLEKIGGDTCNHRASRLRATRNGCDAGAVFCYGLETMILVAKVIKIRICDPVPCAFGSDFENRHNPG